MKNILFITGTRADFGKLKPLMSAVEAAPEFHSTIFVTGMHTLKQYGGTAKEVKKSGFENIYVYQNQSCGEPMDQVLANTINGLSRFLHETPQDLIVVHGDRVETLAGATVGALNNTLVAHVEGGERSGTVDELIRHAVSKLSHIHFVSNEEAVKRLIQMGELPGTIFEIGSPDFDIMTSMTLPSLKEVRARYDILFPEYGVILFHPVTTELDILERDTEALMSAVQESNFPYVVIYPNNDRGNDIILHHYNKFMAEHAQFKIFPSLRFEYFLVLLKNARFIIGNSSAGVREAPYYGVPAINVGTRQHLRYTGEGVVNVGTESDAILKAIQNVLSVPVQNSENSNEYWGKGDSAERFMTCLKTEKFWQARHQKIFQDVC